MATGREPSGAQWCARFPTSTLVSDLSSSFRPKVEAFLADLTRRGCTYHISATYRPEERAYLMHYAYRVSIGSIAAVDVPPHAGVDIDWVAGGQKGAHAMVLTYGIKYAPALISNHTKRTAIDMTLFNAPPGVVELGKSHGVIKLISDPPHWSEDGH